AAGHAGNLARESQECRCDRLERRRSVGQGSLGGYSREDQNVERAGRAAQAAWRQSSRSRTGVYLALHAAGSRLHARRTRRRRQAALRRQVSPAVAWRRQPDAGTRTPLVVLLHGRGADELDLIDVATLLPKTFAYASLRAPYELFEGGYNWYEHL